MAETVTAMPAESTRGEAQPTAATNRVGTWLWVLVIPVSLALAYWWFEALVGFNPTDDGFVLAQSWRLLQGQLIHVDFTSPRPLGSAFLHLPEVISPWATLAISRLVVVAQQLWIASATVGLIDRLRRLSPAQRGALMIVAFMLNTGVWPMMAWHTVDGIFLGITALWLARRATGGDAGESGPPQPNGTRARLMIAAWLLAGAAPLVKQGFVVVPLLVALIVVVDRRARSLLWAPLMAVPWLAYLAAAGWRLDVIRAQLYSGSSGELTKPLSLLLDLVGDPLGLGTIVAAALACWLAWSGRTRPITRVIAAVLVMAPTVVIGAVESYAMAGVLWPFLAVLSLMVVAVWLVGRWRDVAVVVALLGLAFAATASWGVPNPGLLAGSMAAAAGGLLVIGRDPVGDAPGAIGHGRAVTRVLLVFAVLVSGAVINARSDNVYREGSRSELTVRSGLPALAGVRLSPQTAAFTDGLRACVDRADVDTVAVIPGGPGLYPLLRMTSPFDLDWWLPVEYPPDIRSRTLADISRLNGEAGWLVLFQTYDLARLNDVPLTQLDRRLRQVVPFGAEVAGVFDALEGQPINCGSLAGEYRPG